MSTDDDEEARALAQWEEILREIDALLEELEYFEWLDKAQEEGGEDEHDELGEEETERPQCLDPCLIPCTQSGLGPRVTFAFNGVSRFFAHGCTVSVTLPGTDPSSASVSVEARAIPSRLIGTPCDGFAEGTGGPTATTELGVAVMGGMLVFGSSSTTPPIALPSSGEPIQGYLVTVATAALPTTSPDEIAVTVTFSESLVRP